LSVPHARGYLLVRRCGGVWGIANSDVERLARDDEGYRIAVASGEIAADAILGVVEDLAVRPPAPVLRRFWSESPAGVAVHGHQPVVVVDPRHLPDILRLDGGEVPDDEGRD
jgi:hypothetical protein